MLPRARRSASLAAGCARLVGELAVLRRGGDGLVSDRAEVLAELPRHGAPPAFRSYAEWEEFAERFIRLGLADDYTRFWWDIRPHPRFGTLEIRMPDQPTELERTVGFVALLKGLCDAVLERPPVAYDPAGRGMYQQNRWAASRFGLAAELVHPDGDRTARASELAIELAALAGEDGLDPTRMEADRQLEVGEPRASKPSAPTSSSDAK